MTHKNYVLAERKRWAISQADLANLLDISAEALSRYETGKRPPHLSLTLGLEVIFGLPARAFFPDRYAEIEAGIIRRAAAMSIRVEHRSSEGARMQRELLALMNARACTNHHEA